MYIGLPRDGGFMIARLPHWEDPTDEEIEILFNAGYYAHETLEEVFKACETSWPTYTDESEEHFADLYPETSRRDAQKVCDHMLFDLLLIELSKAQRAYCYPWKYVDCERCNGTGRHLYGSMRGYCYTEQDRYEMGERDWEDMMSGRYDVECENPQCDHGKVRVPSIPEQQFEVNYDSIKYTEFLKRMREELPHGPCPTDYRGKRVWNRKTQHGTYERNIPCGEEQWVVDLYHDYHDNERDNEAQARADRQTMWGEMGVPLHERY